MRISNAFNIYELIFVFLVNFLKISTVWGRGKYFSDYEYPEIQLLFSAKEETNEDGGSKTGNVRTVQNNAGFSPAIDSDNPFLESSEPEKLTNEQMLKPWMRKPYTEDINNEKKSNDEDKERNSEELTATGEKTELKNNHVKETVSDNVEERHFWPSEDKPRKIISNYLNSRKDPDNDSGDAEQTRTMKYHKRVKIQNHNRISPFRGDSNNRIKNQVAKDADKPRHEERVPGNDIELKQAKEIALNNANDKLYSGSRGLHEYEENVREYEELTGMLNKNDVVPANNQPPTPSAVSPIKEELTNITIQNLGGLKVANEKIESAKVGSAVTNLPVKEATHTNATNDSQGSEKKLFISIIPPSLFTETTQFFIGLPPTTSTNPSLASLQEKNLKQHVLMSNLKLNTSQANDEMSKENGMVVRQPNRAMQENHPLLAKPPVKIAGTLLDKHSEEDNEVVLEEKDNKIVKVAQLSSIIQSSTVIVPIDMSVGLRSNAPISSREQGKANTVVFNENYDLSPKKKRDTNDKRNDKIRESMSEKSSFHDAPKKSVDKITEKKSDLQLMDTPIDLDNEESPASRKNKFIKPGYYSLTKSNSALSMVNSLMSKLRPGTFVKKKKNREEKFNEGNKRDAPSAFDIGYDSAYDYYRSKGGKKGEPIRAYYDYENDYDLDYKDNDYPRLGHSNHSALAAEKDLYEYDGRSYSNFPRSKNKSKRKKYRKVEDTYRDIFAHPIGLDDPELQIVREDEDELVKRRMHHKNFASRHHREKLEDKEVPQYQKDETAEVESLPRNHLKNKKIEPLLHARRNKVQISKNRARGENAVTEKKVH